MPLPATTGRTDRGVHFGGVHAVSRGFDVEGGGHWARHSRNRKEYRRRGGREREREIRGREFLFSILACRQQVISKFLH